MRAALRSRRRSAGGPPDGSERVRRRSSVPRARARVVALDAAVLAWAAAWVVMGVLVAGEVRGLSDLSRTVTTAGAAVEQSGRLIGRLDGLPVIGADARRTADQVVAAGRQAQQSGRDSRRSVRRLSLLLGVTIAVLPSAPLILYGPWRLGERRSRRERVAGASSPGRGGDAPR